MHHSEKTLHRGGFASRAVGLGFMLAACTLIAMPAESATNWDWVQTGGGCYTPNVVFSEVQQGLAYARTDWGSTNDGAKVQLYSNWGGPMQKFTFTPADSGYFRITPISSPNSCLDVTGISTADGTTIQQWTYWGCAGQQWSIQNP